MYTFPKHPKTDHGLYLRSDLANEIVSAARFRNDMFALYRRFPDSISQRTTSNSGQEHEGGIRHVSGYAARPLGGKAAEDFLRPLLSEVNFWRNARADAHHL